LKKNTFKLKETISARQKSVKQLEESTALKNDVLTNRYEQTEQRINHQLREEQANYMDSREKKIQLFNKRLTSIDVDLKTTYEKHVLELKQNKEHAEQTVKKLQLIEQKNYQRDLLDSKRSYRFKHRTLKL